MDQIIREVLIVPKEQNVVEILHDSTAEPEHEDVHY